MKNEDPLRAIRATSRMTSSDSGTSEIEVKKLVSEGLSDLSGDVAVIADDEPPVIVDRETRKHWTAE